MKKVWNERLLLGMKWAAALLVASVFIINTVFHVATKPYIYQNAHDAPQAQAALIPGAAVLSSGVPTPIFTDRVNLAVELYNEGKVSKILVSGDNSTVSHNEVNPVHTYLLSKGTPDEDIFLDHAGFDTYSSMYRARAIFGVTSILITTQSFHLPRAVFIARSLGIEAYGVNADTGNTLPKNYIREVFADEKAVLDLLFHTKPKYLGDPIPITGDGRNYP